MAKKKHETSIVVDVQTKGLNEQLKYWSSITEEQGELYDYAQKIIKSIKQGLNILGKYDDAIPLDEAKELSRIYETITKHSAKIESMEETHIFSQAELKRIREINDLIAKTTVKIQALEKAKKEEEAAAKKSDAEVLSRIKGQKTVSATDKDGNRVGGSTEKIQGANSREDLQKIVDDNVDPEAVKAATAALIQMDKAQVAHNKTIADYNTKIEKAKQVRGSYYSELDTIRGKVQKVDQAHRDYASGLEEFSEAQKKNIEDAIKNSAALGQTAVNTSRAMDEQNTSLGKAAGSLIKFATAWKLGRALLRESIKTVKEMDESLTGMTVVTGKSREEIYELIPQIQDLSKETSTAMTELAGLITEYTRQGRSLQDSFILAEETAKAAKIAGISAAESIQYMTSAINGFNLAAKDATRVSDVFANLAAISATDYEQLAIALSKVSAQANLAGMSMEYTTALLAKGIETTQEAPESIGTALKTIVARMRELSDYGSVLEDGASVNKVERALSAAGIELRDVNGEFRNLEDIFNELGPKWDKLNTMQQQAIAQAVAGTRQQSRFVAIMQDWERTQELVAEAQDSAGASAAQYLKQAQGMEAAMTNMKTAWQSFIQALTSNKAIIGIVNGVTKILEVVTSIVSVGGEFTQKLGTYGGLILAIWGTVHKHQAKNLSDKEKEAQLAAKENQESQKQVNFALLRNQQQQEIQQKLIEELETILNINKARLAGHKTTLDELEKQREKAKLAKEQAEAELRQFDASYGDAPLTEDQQKERDRLVGNVNSTESSFNTIDGEFNSQKEFVDQNQKIVDSQESNLTEEKNKLLELEKTENDLAQQKSQLLTAQHQELINANNAKIEALNIERESLELTKQKLIAEQKLLDSKIAQAKASGDTKAVKKLEKEKRTNAKAINKLTDQQAKKQKQINKLNKQNNKLTTTQSKTLMQIADKLTGGVASGVMDFAKGIKDGFVALSETIGQLIINAQLRKKAEEDITEEKEEQNEESTKSTVTDGVNTIIAEKREESEEEISEAKGEQVVEGTLTTIADKADETVTEGREKAEKDVTKEKKKGFFQAVANAIANIGSSAGQPYGVGLPFAIAGIAILALAGVGIALGSISKQKNSDAAKESAIAESQADIYAKKNQNKTIRKNRDEYSALISKEVKTEDDLKRIEELEKTIGDLDDSLKNKTGKDLINAMNDLERNNTASIENQIQSNYELAITMDKLNDSQVGKQAIEDKLALSQEKLLESNYALKNSLDTSPEAVMSKLAEANAVFAEHLGDIDKDKRDAVTKQFEEASTKFVADMEMAGDSLADQLAVYQQHTSNLTGEVGELTKRAFDSIYGAYGYLDNLAKNTANSDIKFADTLTRISEVNATLGEADKISSEAIASITQSLLSLQQVEEKDYSTLTTIDFNKKAADVGGDRYGKTWAQWAAEFGMSTDNMDYELLLAKWQQKYKDDASDKWNGGYMGNENRAKKVEAALIEMANAQKNANTAGLSKTEIIQKQSFEYLLNSALPEVLNKGFSDLVNDVGSGTNLAQAYYNMGANVEQGLLEGAGLENSVNNAYSELMAAYTKLENATTEDAKNAARKEISEKQAAYEHVKSLADKFETTLETAIKNAAGYMDSLTFDNTVTSLKSSQETVSNLKEKAMSGEWEVEDYQKLQSEILPALRKAAEERGEIFNEQQVLEQITSGSMEGIGYLTDYYNTEYKNTIDELSDALVGYQNDLIEAEQDEADALWKLQEAKKTGNSTAIAAAQAEYDAAVANKNVVKDTIAVKEIELKQAKELKSIVEGMSFEEVRQRNRRMKLDALENKQNISSYQERLKLLKEIQASQQTEIEEEEEKLKKRLNLSDAQLSKYMKVINGQIHMDEKWYDALSEEQKGIVTDYIEGIEEKVEAEHEARQEIEDLWKEAYETQVDQQSQLLEMYKAKLEKEQEDLQESLDKRKEMYEKYFDSLEEEESDATFEAEQARLQRAITALSTATDATSLTKLKEYQEQLQQLEDEQLQTERDRRIDATMENLDNQSEAIDQYYKARLENEQALWKEITKMGKDGIEELMTKYNEDYKNATELNQAYMLLSYKQLHADILDMMGSDKAAEAVVDYENYKRWMEQYVEDPTIGDYNSKKSYSKGGLVDYTGLAMVHGSTSNPEAFLNASQTAMFAQLSKNLEAFYSHSSGYNGPTDDNNSVVIENFTIAVDATLTDSNVQQTGESLADALLEGLRRTGISVNMKK